MNKILIVNEKIFKKIISRQSKISRRMNTKYITRSAPKTIDELEEFMHTIQNNYVSKLSDNKDVYKIFNEYRELLNNCEKTDNKEKKLENIKIMFNNLIFVEKFYFLFQSKPFRLAVVNKIKYLYKYDKSFYTYIPYVYSIFELIKKKKNF